ncbi:DUF416 family protein [Cryobacterium sp. M23]|uniref:DUF416 family protein n=1 Tax=Cryobacterium sp. M23 TaxID=2048292 RepID=UPI0011AFF55A|nr:DUF416 family protein [Cryobacterium sp. M23]
MRTYDERAVLARLEPLDRRAKTAFAAACAQRLFPLFERYARVVNHPAQSQRLALILAGAWDLASGQADDMQQMEAEASTMVPDEDDDGWVLESGYAQNAAAAVAYTISTWRKDDAQHAVWAALQMYEVADYAFWRTKPNADVNDRGPDSAVLRSEFVQTALSAIDRDLDAAASSPLSWLELRQRTTSEGLTWAAILP